MQRKINFRAWDINNRKMVYFGLYSLLVDGTEADEYWKTHYERGMIDLEIMQYTGLKDKNGKEIYEEDRLEGHADGIVTVKYKDCGYLGEFEDGNVIPLDELVIWFGNQATVVGNTYEREGDI